MSSFLWGFLLASLLWWGLAIYYVGHAIAYEFRRFWRRMH